MHESHPPHRESRRSRRLGDHRGQLVAPVRNTLRLAAAALVAALGLSACSLDLGSPDKERPNILLMIGDDHSQTDAGCYGNGDVQTPSIDALARQGMRFTRCFSGSAMCTPARSMLYTGLYPVRSGAHPNHTPVHPGTESIAHHLKALGYRVALAGKTHVGDYDSFPFEYLPGSPEAVEAFMAEASAQGPFCLIFASENPHAPWREGNYDPAALTLPPYIVDTPDTRQALANYYFEVTQLDLEVGSCLDALDRLNLVEDTITIYASEQGSQFPHGKWTCYDAGLRAQFIVRWPGHVAAEVIADAMISYADVVPTLIELAGGDPIEDLDGTSFAAVLRGETSTHQDAVFGVHTTRGIIDGSACYPIRSIRTATHKYIWNLNSQEEFRNTITAGRHPYWLTWVEAAETDPHARELVDAYRRRPAEELYDLAMDPWELHNIADDPANGELKSSLRERLEAFMVSQGDEGIITEMRVPPHKSGNH